MQISTRALEDNAVDGSKFLLKNNQLFRARNATDSADVQLFYLNAANEWTLVTKPKFNGYNIVTLEDLVNYINLDQVGVTIATLDGSGKVPAYQLPSYVDDVLNYANLGAFPATGETGKIYINEALNLSYRWTGSAYTPITSVISSTSDVPEGSNLYFTDTRARTAAVLNTTAGTETNQAPSVAAMKAYVAAAAPPAAAVDVQTFTLNSTDITNGYIALSRVANKILAVFPKGWPAQQPTDDYTTSTVSSATRITFAGDMLSLVSGDKVTVSYSY